MSGDGWFPARDLAALAAVLVSITHLPARTFTVDDDGPAEFAAIQPAIDAAAAGDVVSVAAGVYAENLRLKSGVPVLGAGASVTTIDGRGLAAVARLTDCDGSTRLEGFRLTGGVAPAGGGVWVVRGAPVIRFNEITGNRAGGGGAYLYGYGGGVALVQSAASLSDNVLSANQADFGGGVHLEGGGATIARNLIAGNSAGAGGGVSVYVVTGAPLITANTLRSNQAIFGGGLELAGPGAPVVSSNLIVGNSAVASGAGTGLGGGADAYYSGVDLAGNTFYRNVARTGGGVSLIADGAPRVAGNVLLENDASSAGGALDLEAPGAAVLDNLWYLNGRGTCSGSSAFLCAEASNLEADPLLAEPAGPDCRPRDGSPAIDSFHAAVFPAHDLLGRRRPLDGDRDGDPKPDRGACEHDRDDVPGLEFESLSRLAWGSVSGATGYHVYSGSVSAGGGTLQALCRDPDDDDPSDQTFPERLDPRPGEAYLYLVTAVVAGGERSPGFDSRGIERSLSVSCP